MTIGQIGCDWRDSATYAGIASGGRSALAWELLRRNPDYRRVVREASGSAVDDAFVARWGLHFP